MAPRRQGDAAFQGDQRPPDALQINNLPSELLVAAFSCVPLFER